MATLTASYPYTNSDAARPLYQPGYMAMGQSFEAAVTGTLHSMQFEMYKVGTPPGTLQAHLVQLNGTYGDGDDVGTSTVLASSSTVDPTTLGVTTGGLVEFAFDDTVTVTQGTGYVAIVMYTDGGLSNASNCPHVRRQNSGSHPGNVVVGVTHTNTTTDTAGRDTIFYVYVSEADETAPVITVTGVTDGYNNVGPVTITFSATDAVDGSVAATATLDGAAFTSGSAVSDNGIYELVVTASDAAENTATSTIRFALRDLDSGEGSPSITHAFVSAKEDSADTSLLQPSDWNADHTITGGINDSFTVGGVTYTIVNGFVTVAE